MREKWARRACSRAFQFVRKALQIETRERFPGKIMESFALQRLISETRNDDMPLDRFFSLVHEFSSEMRKEHDALLEMESFINSAYFGFSPERREEFFRMLYDEFSESYDAHMEATGHYAAIKNLMYLGGGFLKVPLLDITAGTGEPLLYAIEAMEAAQMMRGSEFVGKKIGDLPLLKSSMDYRGPLRHLFYANEISPKMLDKSSRKITNPDVSFINGSAYALPKELKGRMKTVLSTQIFHLVSPEDKIRLVLSIREALAEGGIAMVMEEDPFRITPTPQIEPISMFLRAAVSPIKRVDALIGLFEVNGFDRIQSWIVEPIDEHHNMILHLFRKSSAHP